MGIVEQIQIYACRGEKPPRVPMTAKVIYHQVSVLRSPITAWQ
jgi:hypothetical protein